MNPSFTRLYNNNAFFANPVQRVGLNDSSTTQNKALPLEQVSDQTSEQNKSANITNVKPNSGFVKGLLVGAGLTATLSIGLVSLIASESKREVGRLQESLTKLVSDYNTLALKAGKEKIALDSKLRQSEILQNMHQRNAESATRSAEEIRKINNSNVAKMKEINEHNVETIKRLMKEIEELRERLNKQKPEDIYEDFKNWTNQNSDRYSRQANSDTPPPPPPKTKQDHFDFMNELAEKYNFSTVSKISDITALKSLYKKLMQKVHPDLNQNEDTTSIAQALNEAYEVLVKNHN